MVLALVAVGVSASVLLTGTVVGRRALATVPDRASYLAAWSMLHGGLDVGSSTLVRGWLVVVYRLARPLARAGVAPALLTAWGVLAGILCVAVADLGGRWVLLAVIVVVLSGVLDGLDGAVAVLTDRTSRLGFVLDSVADRVVDGLYLAALWRVGAPAGACVAAGAAVGLLEYTRARAGAAGMREIGVVTAGERPTRVILTTATLLCAGMAVGPAGPIAAAGASAILIFSLVGLVQLVRVIRRYLV